LFDDGDVNDTVFEQYITKQSGSGAPIQVGDKVAITWPARYAGEKHPAIITAGPAKNKGALEYYKKVLEIALQTGDISDQGNAYSGMGICMSNLGRVQEAIEMHKKHLETCLQSGEV
jgi:tetratricopeptide (TPR) repeat protein